MQILKYVLFRFAMEEIRVLRSFFLLFLVAGMHVGNSSAAAVNAWDDCYDTCFKTCAGGSFGGSEVIIGCGANCAAVCDNIVHGKACILFWCWNTK